MIAAALLAGCAVPEPVEAAVVAANPLLELDRDIDRTPFSGVADEVRAAGGYEYVRIGERWAVGLAKDLAPGDALTVRPIGVAHGFASRRTGDRYDELWFAVLTPEVNATP